ncbi:trypsin-like peptidase domain-containing protein [Sphingobacterium thalpophilum]|uniref:trypsin-like peptidase domain-containing protein n=1 Tax=Sphingobacterium thalpophilum TaxID=259 RepID=UPI003DA46878
MANKIVIMGFGKFLLCLGLALSISMGYGQMGNDPKRMEGQIAKCIEKAFSTSVHIIEYDTLNKTVKEGLSESDGFSGVVVSAEGHILTVSHAAVPGEVYQIRFPDGKRYVAIGLGRIGLQAGGKDHDLAMLKMTAPGKWPYAQMGNTADLSIDELLVGISYPSSFNKLYPNIRVGKLTDLDASDGFITSTVKMEPGDSGGPLFDLQGRVVGIRSFINENEAENFDVPIELFRKYWTALNIAKDYTSLPRPDVIPVSKKAYSLNPEKLIDFSDKIKLPENNIITIRSTVGNEKVHLLGTLVSKGDRAFIISKNAGVGSAPQVHMNGRAISLRILHRDRENDLIIMESTDPIGEGIPMDDVISSSRLETPDLGRFLISDLGGGNRKLGVLGAVAVDLPPDFSIGYCGASAVYNEGKITFSEVAGQGTAKTPLRKGDQVVKINDVPIKEAADYDREFANYLAGDSIRLDLIRDGRAFQAGLYLSGQPTFKHVSFDYPGGRSARSDDYKQVLVQDAAIKPQQCGGAVFDLDGRFVGINIARHSRTSTIITPISIINELLENYISTF